MIRVILAGVLGGSAIFIAGAFAHTALNWGGRTLKPFPNETAMRELAKGQQLTHGAYSFPNAGASASAEDLAAAYSQGNGILFLGRLDEQPMTSAELGSEAATNIFAAFLCAWIVAQLSPRANFFHRWLIVVIIGLVGWLSISASHNIWFRFHWEWARDELFGILLEMLAAGAVIAAIVRSQPEPASTT